MVLLMTRMEEPAKFKASSSALTAVKVGSLLVQAFSSSFSFFSASVLILLRSSWELQQPHNQGGEEEVNAEPTNQASSSCLSSSSSKKQHIHHHSQVQTSFFLFFSSTHPSILLSKNVGPHQMKFFHHYHQHLFPSEERCWVGLSKLLLSYSDAYLGQPASQFVVT